ncbi:MAG: HypC/HybG/HupF family hydrogenase formation chaperone [Desulfurococcales archaeon]|jgi:hydrogenase expression/formation protein HypC|nr:HypC/HybG/HupF family hydrogenase formation chaperone [Desulfurococcales archaeon]
MCWGVPAVVKKIFDDNLRALVDYGDGIDREVIIGVSDEDIKVGDVVIVHAGVIISKIDEKDLDLYEEYIEKILRDERENPDLSE